MVDISGCVLAQVDTNGSHSFSLDPSTGTGSIEVYCDPFKTIGVSSVAAVRNQ
jgi:hypothetical protein